MGPDFATVTEWKAYMLLQIMPNGTEETEESRRGQKDFVSMPKV
jgi:hypothetical protein